jgi:hypothetical protein
MFQGIPCNIKHFMQKSKRKDKLFLCEKYVEFVLYLIILTKAPIICDN